MKTAQLVQSPLYASALKTKNTPKTALLMQDIKTKNA
jgi:hypothetical protein